MFKRRKKNAVETKDTSKDSNDEELDKIKKKLEENQKILKQLDDINAKAQIDEVTKGEYAVSKPQSM